MNFNPFFELHNAALERLNGLKCRGEEIAADRRQHENFDPAPLERELKTHEATIATLKAEKAPLDKDIDPQFELLYATNHDIEAANRLYAELSGHIEHLELKKSQVGEELQWYASIVPSALADELKKNEVRFMTLNQEMSALDQEIANNSLRLSEMNAAIKPTHNPLHWLSIGQLKLRRQRDHLCNTVAQMPAHRNSLAKDIEETIARTAIITRDIHRYNVTDFAALKAKEVQIKHEIDQAKGKLAAIADQLHELEIKRDHLRERCRHIGEQRQTLARVIDYSMEQAARITGDLYRYKSTDITRLKAEGEQIRQDIARANEELRDIMIKKQQVDELLAPILLEIKSIESSISQAESDINDAQGLYSRLEVESNRSVRHTIFEECRQKFGDSSPRRIIPQRQGKLEQLKRDLEKSCRRAREVGNKSARNIKMIVIDGNNLCYDEDKKFIGLVAIEKLLPALSPRYSVYIVFDSGIHRLLKTDEAGLHKRLGSHAKVHVVANNQKADETILDLASMDPTTYVLSNDRFADYRDKSAVKCGRTITFEIIGGNIFVHDLQQRIAYK